MVGAGWRVPARAVRPGAGGDPRALAAVPAGGGGDRLRGEPATQKARWLRQSLPFAVEEQLADDVEQMHLALGPALADGRHRVFAVQRTWLAAWLALAEGAGKAPASLHVDADCLPGEGSCLFWLEERWLLGGSGAVRLACGSEDWPVLRDSCPPPQRAFAAQEVAPLEGGSPGPGGQSARLAERAAAGHRPGPGRVRRAPAEQPARRWRPLLGLVGLWLVLQWGFTLVQAWQLQREGDRYAAQSAELYRQLFPEDRKLINLRAQFDQHLADSASSGGEGQLLGLRPGRHGDRRRADGERRATGLQRRSRRRRPPGAGSRFRRAGTAAFASQRVRAGGAAGFGQPRWLDGQRAPGDRRLR